MAVFFVASAMEFIDFLFWSFKDSHSSAPSSTKCVSKIRFISLKHYQPPAAGRHTDQGEAESQQEDVVAQQ